MDPTSHFWSHVVVPIQNMLQRNPKNASRKHENDSSEVHFQGFREGNNGKQVIQRKVDVEGMQTSVFDCSKIDALPNPFIAVRELEVWRDIASGLSWI